MTFLISGVSKLICSLRCISDSLTFFSFSLIRPVDHGLGSTDYYDNWSILKPDRSIKDTRSLNLNQAESLGPTWFSVNLSPLIRCVSGEQEVSHAVVRLHSFCLLTNLISDYQHSGDLHLRLKQHLPAKYIMFNSLHQCLMFSVTKRIILYNI